MAKKKSVNSSPPDEVLTDEARENRIISAALDEAERRIRDGTASSQLITHFLKLGSIRAQAELESLRQDTELKKAKTKAINDAESIEDTVQNAMDALRGYRKQS